jgi:flavorubredoxin
MTTRIDEIVDGIYRIATMAPGYGITFNQFLVDDERPTLIHTGDYPAYEGVREAIREVLDPGSLAYVLLLHFESDECGGMQRFVDESKGATLVGSELSARLNLDAWDYRGPYLGMKDGETLELGRHTLRFLETPHVHHWDSMMVFEESTKSVFPADLFIQPGDQPPVIREDLTEEMIDLYRAAGIFAHEDPVRKVVDRIEALEPEWIHAMHGGTLTKEIAPRFYRALRERQFAFQGKLLGREIPVGAPVPVAS